MSDLGCRHGIAGACTACTSEARKDILQQIDAVLYDAGFRGGSLIENVRKAVADAQALADMRTLDDWQGKIGREMWSDLFGGPGGFIVSLDTEYGEAHEFRAESFPEARAKAAAWVREQKP